MKKIAKYLGGGPDSDEQMMKVYEFETKVAMVSNDLSMTSIVRSPCVNLEERFQARLTWDEDFLN